MDRLWWENITNTSHFIDQIVEAVQSGSHLFLQLPQFVPWYETMSDLVISKIERQNSDRSLKIMEAGQIKEEDFFCHVTHKTWDTILHDIRKAHENDSESAPDTTPADELIREVQKAMQSPGDRVQQFTELFCKAFQLKYKRLSEEERTTLKKLFRKSPLIKHSGMNFRRRPWK